VPKGLVPPFMAYERSSVGDRRIRLSSHKSISSPSLHYVKKHVVWNLAKVTTPKMSRALLYSVSTWPGN
jgi:hypothetical protein